MAKFGELINAEIPVLIDFFSHWDESTEMPNDVLRDVVTKKIRRLLAKQK